MKNKNASGNGQNFFRKIYGVFTLFLIAGLVLFPVLSLQAADPQPGLNIPAQIYRGDSFDFFVYGAKANADVQYFCTSPSGKNCGGFSLGTTDSTGQLTVTRTMATDEEIGDHTAYVTVGTGTSDQITFSVLGSGGTTIQWPTLPAISKVELGDFHFTGYEGRVVDPERMSVLDSRTITIYDASGKPYPAEAKNADGSIRAQVVLDITLRRGDGVLCGVVTAGAGCALGALTFGDGDGATRIGVPPGYGKVCVWVDGSCTYPLNSSDPARGAPIPGDVIIEKIVAEAIAFAGGTQQKITSPVYAPGLKVFRVADPPKINSVNKTSAKHNDTITIDGLNLDSGGASEYLWANQIIFDLDRDTLKGSRTINNWSGTEDLIHYCGKDKLKFEVPTDVPAGSHTITLVNDWGYSNTLSITVNSGSGTPENDPACEGTGGKITSISPTKGPVNSQLTINGKNFGSATSGASSVIVSINNATVASQNIRFTKTDGSQLVVFVPSGATTGRVTVKPAGRSLIVGPIFTVTGGSGGGGGSSSLSLDGVAPDQIYPSSENEIVIEGKNIANDATLTTDNPLVTVTDVGVNSEGTSLSATLQVSLAVAGPIKFTVNSGGEAASVSADIAQRDPSAPEISGVSVSPTETAGEAAMVLTGTNFDDVNIVEIRGEQSLVVKDYTKNQGEIVATVTVLDFNPNVTSFVSRALAATIDRALVQVSSSNGKNSTFVDTSKFQTQSSAPNQVKPVVISQTGFENICNREAGLASCVQKIYLFSLGLGALIAMLMVVLAGYRYMTAQGNAEQVESAKGAFSSAFIGLIIIFVAFILLYLINPDFVKFKELKLPPINTKTSVIHQNNA